MRKLRNFGLSNASKASKAIVLIQKNDLKAKMWAKAASERKDIELRPTDGSPLIMPLILISTLMWERPIAICFRYVNDYPSLLKSCCRATTDIITIVIACIFRIKILWVCHNVGQQTQEHYKLLTAFRIIFLIRMSSKVFVTDSLLVRHAAHVHKIPLGRLDVISFGAPLTPSKPYSLKVNRCLARIKDWQGRIRSHSPNAIFALWIGTLIPKTYSGIRQIPEISRCSRDLGKPIYFIVIGPTDSELEEVFADSDVIQGLKDCTYCTNEKIDLPASTWRSLADFVWKPMSDYSVPYTAYCAASAGLPLCCLPNSFLGVFITHHKLGITVYPTLKGLNTFFKELENWDPQCAAAFIKSHTWEDGSNALVEASIRS